VPVKPERRFTLLDAMILVAATAVGLALAREWARMITMMGILASPEEGLLPELAPLTRQVVLGWPVVTMATLAVVALRLRRPRPPRRRLFAPPGVVACVVAACVIALDLAHHALIMIEDYFQYPQPANDAVRWGELERRSFQTVASTSVGFAVAASWLAMALARRWRPERTWIDRAGIVVGWLWIALVVIRFQLATNSHLNV
jgi:hypothetical protein